MKWVKIFSNEADAKEKMSSKPQLLVVHDKRICLVLYAGNFFAVQDSCTHSGTSLSNGQVNFLGEIICPLHHYCFELKTGKEMMGRSVDLQTFPLKIDDSGFFIGI